MTTMHIAIDRQVFTIQKHGGVSRYFSDLYLGLRQQPKVNATLLFKRHQNTYLNDKNIGEEINPTLAKFYGNILTKFKIGIPLASEQDIHHSTYYLGKPFKTNNSAKLVCSLYDMIPELHPSYFKQKPHANKIDWLNASDLIISISDTAASDLAYFQPHLAQRICRIHLYSGFNSNSPSSRPQELSNDSDSYLLFVGNRGGYKNAEMLIRAFAANQQLLQSHQLIFAGGGKMSREELAILARLGITDKVKQITVSDSELWYLYTNAKSVLVPSIAEGFSLPLVEGLAADIPVVCSDIPVHREVAKEFATFLSPMQIQDWSEIIHSIDTIKRPSEILGQSKYKAICNYFSKERMVNEHILAYKDLLETRKT